MSINISLQVITVLSQLPQLLHRFFFSKTAKSHYQLRHYYLYQQPLQSYLAEFYWERGNFQTNLYRNQNIQLCPIIPTPPPTPRKLSRLRDNVEKYCGMVQATDGSIIRGMRFESPISKATDNTNS